LDNGRSISHRIKIGGERYDEFSVAMGGLVRASRSSALPPFFSSFRLYLLEIPPLAVSSKLTYFNFKVLNP